MSDATPVAPARSEHADPGQRVFLHDVRRSDFERILAIRGDRPVPRMTHLKGGAGADESIPGARVDEEDAGSPPRSLGRGAWHRARRHRLVDAQEPVPEAL